MTARERKPPGELRAPSRSAVLTAVGRALHREEPPPWVLDDTLAEALAGGQAAEMRAQLKSELSPEALLGFSRWLCVRARVPEDVVEEAVAGGVHQYVLLGAGLDSFAYRRTDMAGRLHVFEVDHPASQAWKRQALAGLGIQPPANLTFAPIDFEHQTLGHSLQSAGFDWRAPAVFSWIGVTMYLTLEAIEETLGAVAACPPGTRLVVTYNRRPEKLEGLALQTEGALRRVVAAMGEPMVSVFEPDEAEALLRRSGFAAVEHIGPDEARHRYFPGRDDVRFGGAQRLLVGSVV